MLSTWAVYVHVLKEVANIDEDEQNKHSFQWTNTALFLSGLHRGYIPSCWKDRRPRNARNTPSVWAFSSLGDPDSQSDSTACIHHTFPNKNKKMMLHTVYAKINKNSYRSVNTSKYMSHLASQLFELNKLYFLKVYFIKSLIN